MAKEIERTSPKHLKQSSSDQPPSSDEAGKRFTISFGSSNITIPYILESVTETLKNDKHYSIQNPKSKRAFMYSSPWAALKLLDIHQDENSYFHTPTHNQKGQ